MSVKVFAGSMETAVNLLYDFFFFLNKYLSHTEDDFKKNLKRGLCTVA